MNLIPWMLGIPLCGALLTALCGRRGKPANAVALAAEIAVLLLAAGTFLFPAGGLDSCRFLLVGEQGLAFAADGFRRIWVLLTAFAFAMSGLVSPGSVSRAQARYQTATLLALTGTLGVFLAADFYTLFVFFEMMSLSSWLWVLHEETDGAKYAANTYLAVGVLGGLVMLMGVFLLRIGFDGAPSFALMRQMDYSGVPRPLLYLAGALLLFGFAAKAGLFPLHFWLPMSYTAAPAPASALLSSILSKCGVLGMLLLATTLFRGSFRWGEIVLALGVVTMALGAVLALCSVDLKRTLACSSVSQIGFIAIGVGLISLLGADNALAVRGTVLHMVNHTLIKLTLFLAAGVFAKNRGTLDLNKLRGAGRGNLPLLLAFLTGAWSVAGIPGGSGYLSKTMLHESILEYAGLVRGADGAAVPQLYAVEWLFLISGGLTLAYMTKLFLTLFVAAPAKGGKPLRMDAATLTALAAPSAALWALGLAPHPLTDKMLDLAQPALTEAALEQPLQYFSLANLRGGAISLAIGAAVYFFIARRLLRRDGKWINVVPAWCDLERKIYRPLFLRVLPNAAGLVCRLVDCSLDGLVVLLRRTVFCNLGKPKREVAGVRLTDTLGRLCDRVVELLNRTVRRKEPIEHRSFVYIFAEREREAVASSRLISASLSFGMLLACAGLVATLLYLLV